MRTHIMGTDTVPPRYPHLHPDYLEAQDAKREAEARAVADYLEDWISGELYDDGDVYSGPVERLIEDDWLVQVLAAEDDEALLQAAKIVQAKLRQFVEEQAKGVV